MAYRRSQKDIDHIATKFYLGGCSENGFQILVHLKKCRGGGSSWCGSVVTNPTSFHENVGSIPGPAQWVKDPALPRAAV